jgi:hypothetical protein
LKDYDPSREDRYALPKAGKMLMGNRDPGPHDESKDFTDKLGPLKRWLNAKVGRNRDRVYSEMKQAFPNTNKQNQHLIDTHLPGYINCNAVVEKSEKGRRVISWTGMPASVSCGPAIFTLTPKTHVLMCYPKRPASRRAV